MRLSRSAFSKSSRHEVTFPYSLKNLESRSIRKLLFKERRLCSRETFFKKYKTKNLNSRDFTRGERMTNNLSWIRLIQIPSFRTKNTIHNAFIIRFYKNRQVFYQIQIDSLASFIFAFVRITPRFMPTYKQSQ